jgi:hypothetical protein
VTPVQDQTGTAPARMDGHRMPPPGSRSADEIRRDVVQQRQQLSRSVDALRTRWGEVTNVRHQIRQHRTELLVGAAAVGFLIGGAIALSRRRG